VVFIVVIGTEEVWWRVGTVERPSGSRSTTATWSAPN